MVNNFTPNLKRRSDDVYSPGGSRNGRTGDDCVHEPVHDSSRIPGRDRGIEASLRRFAHYDYWQDSVRQAILADAPANLLVFGMGERQIVEIAPGSMRGKRSAALRDIRGTSYTIGIAEWRNAPPEERSNFRALPRSPRIRRLCPGLCPPL